ncbi:hypothetical protein SAMN05216267_104046 [Actinacidiphila rubida]|uniref:Nucleopolyhedrovirus P10 family protein n=1 Tax=Actinacidiphila rubida TaxID=310780 RepID=A0A1H8SA64_9ACTN|nr:hypothetical protein [Actinacidiphila rubida]SEO75522.1 hypothetical protein SAMN05216267_104046 [Actinacidiphila rubida]
MDRLGTTVREQVALGRLLPLGTPDDPLWITERAAAGVLRRAADALPGVRLGPVAILLDGPAGEVPDAAPPGALPHGPLRIEADVETTVDEPLPVVVARLRDALWQEAEDALGATVTAVDLAVTGILDGPVPPDGGRDGAPADDGVRGADPDAYDALAASVAAAVCAVTGVRGLTRHLGTLPGVRVTDDGDAPGRRRVQLQIAVGPGRAPLPVARDAAAAAATAAAAGALGPVSVALVVTDAF